jgi:hypothetical protein
MVTEEAAACAASRPGESFFPEKQPQGWGAVTLVSL